MSDEQTIGEIMSGVEHALGTVFGKQCAMATKWMVITEVAEEDGTLSLIKVNSENMRSWQSLMLAQSVLEMAKKNFWES